MLEQTIDCIVDRADNVRLLRPVRPDGVAALLQALPPAQAAFLRDQGFKAAAGDLHMLPGPDGIDGAVLGLGEDCTPHAFGGLALRLPEGSAWRLDPGDYDPQAAVLGFCLGAYRYTAFTPAMPSAADCCSSAISISSPTEPSVCCTV